MQIGFENITRSEIPLGHPILMFDAFWSGVSTDQKSACWSQFNPMSMTFVLPWIVVLDCIQDEDYMFRLCGTGCDRMFNRSLTGTKFSDQVDRKLAKARYDDLSMVKSGSGPLYAKGNLPVPDRDHVKVFRGLYGFTAGADEINRLVLIIAPISEQNGQRY